MLENLKKLEKHINSELSSKIHNSVINNDELLVEVGENDLTEVVQFIKSNEKLGTKYRNFPWSSYRRKIIRRKIQN